MNELVRELQIDCNIHVMACSNWLQLAQRYIHCNRLLTVLKISLLVISKLSLTRWCLKNVFNETQARLICKNICLTLVKEPPAKSTAIHISSSLCC